MEYARHVLGVVVPVKALCYVYGLLCTLSIADLKLLSKYTLSVRTAVCKVYNVSVTDHCCLCGKLRALHYRTRAAADINDNIVVVCWAARPHCLHQI